MRYVLEVAVAHLEDAVLAWQLGADRLELSTALELGGLSPPLSLVTHVRREVPLPLIVLVRPRAGGFCYAPRELAQMQTDVQMFLDAGADGCAVGALRPDRTVDAAALAEFRRHMPRGTLVFHRAFDATSEPLVSLEQLIDAGVDRILSSGGAATALEGCQVLRAMCERAAARMEILPAAGIHPANVRELLGVTGAQQVHGTFRRWAQDAAGPVGDSTYPRLDPDLVREMRSILDQAAQAGLPEEDTSHRHGN